MTRDEARRIISDPKFTTTTDGWLDQLEALGIIKFDAPKSIESRLVAIFGPHATWNFREFENGLRAHGLKIVEA